MTPARFASCVRLLSGIKIQTEINRTQLSYLMLKCDQLQSDLARLAKLIGEDRFADSRLLLSLSRRIGANTSELRQCENQLAVLYQKDAKLNRSTTLLTARIRKHEAEVEEQNMMETLTARISMKFVGQFATRNKY